MRVLYVEDNRINAVLLEETLRLHGEVDVRVAETGQEALALVQEGWTPDLLVLDAHLPGMTGYEVLERLKHEPGLADTPAIMCSADAGDEDRQRAANAGFISYWAKPIDVLAIRADLARLFPDAPGTSGAGSARH